MKKLTPIQEETKIRFPEDIKIISNLLKKEGYIVSDQEIQIIWQAYSDDMYAGWMSLPKGDSYLLELILDYSTLVEYNKYELNRSELAMDTRLIIDQIHDLTDEQVFQLKTLLVEFNLS